MVGVLIVGFIANLLMRPVAESHYATEADVDDKPSASRFSPVRPEPSIETRSS